MATFDVLSNVEDEVNRQINLWGIQSHPFGTESKWSELADLAKSKNDEKVKDGTLTWAGILLEELLEALGEDVNIKDLRTELVQTAAVCVSWINDIDSLKSNLPVLASKIENTADSPL